MVISTGAPLILPAETSSMEKEKSPEEPQITLEPKEPDSPAALEKDLPKPAVTFSPPERYAYAKQLDPESCHTEYKSLMPNMAKKYPFELDAFQQAAVVCMEKGESVFVAAHTSAGKTVVAEYAVAL
ncbi:hypothetical protein OSTOST_25807, partial [Ostertagia ostertagi]